MSKNIPCRRWVIAVFTIASSIVVFDDSCDASRIPDTLRFSGLTFVKKLERAYHVSPRLILVNERQNPAYVMAELFEKSVAFLNKQGKVVTIDSFATEPGFAASKYGDWLYLWGRKNYADSFHRIYGPAGKILFEKIAPSTGNEPSTGIPLKVPGDFLKINSLECEIDIIDTSGNIIHTARPLQDGATGNIIYDTDSSGNMLFVAVSPGDYTIFTYYDASLVEQRHAVLTLNNAILLSAAGDGRFALINFYDAGEGWPLLAVSSAGERLFQISYPKAWSISGNNKFLAVADGAGEVSLINTNTWQSILKIDTLMLIQAGIRGDWRSIDFSDDSEYLLPWAIRR